MRGRTLCSLGVAFALGACGSPAPAPAPAAKAVTPAPAPKPATAPGTPGVMDPKGTLDAVRSTAATASAASAARTQGGADAKGAPIAAVAAAPATEAALTPTGAKYDGQGRRDPFESLEIRAGSERSTVASARLTGVVQSPGAGAYALVETSDGIGYILKAGDTLAEGRLIEIGHNMVVFSIAPKPGAKSNRVVLKLPE